MRLIAEPAFWHNKRRLPANHWVNFFELAHLAWHENLQAFETERGVCQPAYWLADLRLYVEIQPHPDHWVGTEAEARTAYLRDLAEAVDHYCPDDGSVAGVLALCGEPFDYRGCLSRRDLQTALTGRWARCPLCEAIGLYAADPSAKQAPRMFCPRAACGLYAHDPAAYAAAPAEALRQMQLTRHEPVGEVIAASLRRPRRGRPR